MATRCFDLLVGVAHRLFAVDILAGVHGFERDLRVPMIRRGHHDRVDIGLVQQFVIIEITLGLELVGRFALPLLVDVANGDNLAAVVVLVSVILEFLGDVAAASADSDHPDVDAVIRAKHATALFGATGRERGSGHTERNTGARCGLDEVSTVAIRHGFLSWWRAAWNGPH